MRRTVFFILCMQEAVPEVETNARRWLIVDKQPHPSQESQTDWRSRLDTNYSTTIYSTDIDFQRMVAKIGKIAGYILSVLIILLVMISRIMSWSTAVHLTGDLQTRDEEKSPISRLSSLILPPIETNRQVLSEYERLSTLVKHHHSDDFHFLDDVPVFRNTTPVITPFVRKPLKFVPGNKSSIIEYKKRDGKSTSTKYVISIEEKYLVSDPEPSGSVIKFTHREPVDNKGSKSTKRDKYSTDQQENIFHISRNHNKEDGNETEIITLPPNCPSIQLSTIMLPESH